jgi:hypothetical protein
LPRVWQTGNVPAAGKRFSGQHSSEAYSGADVFIAAFQNGPPRKPAMLFVRHDSRSGGRPSRYAIICDAAKANENDCDDGVDLDRELNVAWSPSGFDSNGSVFPVCLASLFLAPSDDCMSEVFRFRVLVHPALSGYDAKSLEEDRREEEEHRHAIEQFQEQPRK